MINLTPTTPYAYSTPTTYFPLLTIDSLTSPNRCTVMSLSPCTYIIIQVLLICYANAGDSSPEITRLRYAHHYTLFSLAENMYSKCICYTNVDPACLDTGSCADHRYPVFRLAKHSVMVRVTEAHTRTNSRLQCKDVSLGVKRAKESKREELRTEIFPNLSMGLPDLSQTLTTIFLLYAPSSSPSSLYTRTSTLYLFPTTYTIWNDKSLLPLLHDPTVIS